MPPGAIVNIQGLTPVDDPEYRYKMPTVFGKVEGRGNGIKTVIPNISEVALSLHRSPAEVNKFFGCELGAQTKYDEHTDRAVVNGAHNDIVLVEMMHRYVEKFVLCPNCGLPESDYRYKGESIYHSCKACGAKEMLDMSHKLTTFILAQKKKEKIALKAAEKKAKKKGGKVDKDSDEGEKKKKKKKDKEKDDEDSHDDKKKKKKDKDKKEKKKKHKKKEKSEDDDDIADGLAEVSVNDIVDDSGAMNLAVDATKKYIAENPEASVNDVVEYVINQQMASALKSFDKIFIYVKAVITSDFFKKNEIAKAAPVLSKITSGNDIMERHLISAIEELCAEKPKNFPVMIKQLFDEDALEEDSIFAWAGEGRSEYTLSSLDEDVRARLRAETEPVIAWLQESDDDSDDSDE